MLKTAFVSFMLLICPCALCYGQLSFSGVNGERGYTAMRGSYRWESDRGILLTPLGEYYRMSDTENDRSGATYRTGLTTAYDWSDNWRTLAHVIWQPRALGYQAFTYRGAVAWQPFYRWRIFAHPWVDVQAGQTFRRVETDVNGTLLQTPYHVQEINLQAGVQTDVGPLHLKGAWQKVLQYNNSIAADVSFSWADIPFMTAVLQGFVREAQAVRASYPTSFITPYLSWARYQYAQTGRPASAVSAGVRVAQGLTVISAGVEVFEPRRELNRKTFFSVSAEINF